MKKLRFYLIMIDKTMLPREGLVVKTFSVLAEIGRPNNSTKLADVRQLSQACIVEETDGKKGSCICMGLAVLQATFTIQTRM